ncbi:hypothetical protein [Enterobacter ludwigii]|uniref:hypothetical protein n=1 Tax=Enterobacter ludwigii TaxID=299767 RepID=UPI0039747384
MRHSAVVLLDAGESDVTAPTLSVAVGPSAPEVVAPENRAEPAPEKTVSAGIASRK